MPWWSEQCARVQRATWFHIRLDDRRTGGDVERSTVGIERLARDVERFVLVEQATAAAAGRASRRGCTPETALLFCGRRWDEDAAVIDFYTRIMSRGNSVNELAGYSPLSLYSAGCFSLSTSEVGARPFSRCSTPLLGGRTFSSCLRKGLRMMGMLKNQCFDATDVGVGLRRG